jgi:hypothetical protein
MSAHAKAQALRFLRATGYAFITALVATGGKLSWWDLLTLGAGAAESGLRQVFQVQPLPFVTSQPVRPTEAPPTGSTPGGDGGR